MAEGMVARVLVCYRGDECFREKRSRSFIRERPPIIAAIPGDPVGKPRIRLQSHALASEHSRPNERRIIHAILRCKLNFPRTVSAGSSGSALTAAKFGTTPNMRFVCLPSELSAFWSAGVVFGAGVRTAISDLD